MLIRGYIVGSVCSILYAFRKQDNENFMNLIAIDPLSLLLKRDHCRIGKNCPKIQWSHQETYFCCAKKDTLLGTITYPTMGSSENDRDPGYLNKWDIWSFPGGYWPLRKRLTTFGDLMWYYWDVLLVLSKWIITYNPYTSRLISSPKWVK